MFRKSVISITAVLCFISLSYGATVISTQNGDWNSGSTWDRGTKPANGDDAVIRGDYTITVSTTETLSTSGNVFEMGKWDGTGGTLNVTSTANMTLNGNVYIGVGSGTSNVNISGGVFSATWAARLGWGAGSKGVVTITGGTVWFGNLVVGGDSGTGELHIDGGLTHLGAFSISSTGLIDITTGRLVLPGNVSNVPGIVGYGGAGTLNYSYDGSTWTNVTANPAPGEGTIISKQDGYWADGSTWTGDVKPVSSGAKVIIRGNNVVTLNTAETLNYTTDNVFEMGKWDNTGGTLNIQSGGSLTLTGDVYIGVGACNAYLNVSGGSFTSNYCTRLGWGGTVVATITSGSMYFGNLQIGYSGNAELHINGGTVTADFIQFHSNCNIDITQGELIVPGMVTDANAEYGVGKITAYGGARSLVYDTMSQPGKTIITAAEPAFVDTIDHNMFAGGVTRAELEGFLSRSLYMGALCVGEGQIATTTEFNAGMSLVERIGAGLDPNVLLEYTAGFWQPFPSATNPYTADFDRFYAAAKANADKVHKRNLYAILGAGVYETAFSKYDRDGYPCRAGVEDVPVPDWVFTAFGETPVTRNFDYSKMIYSDRYRDIWDETNGNASIPDMTKLETKMWFYYHACRYIDSGYEVVNVGQIHMMCENDRPYYANAKQVIDMIRAYAATHARRKWVFLSADTHGVVDSTGHLLFDYHSFPLRPKGVAGHPGEAVLDASYQDSIYGKSMGGIAPSGWSCTHLPYTVHFDNTSGKCSDDHTVNSVTPWVWNWDESAWFAHQSELYRNNWLWYAYNWIRTNDNNGYICMSGRKICQDPVNFDGYLSWMYKADTYVPLNYGFNQEETIKAIWHSTCSGYNYANLNGDCRVSTTDLAVFAQKWQNVTDCENHFAIDRQDFNGDCHVDIKDLQVFALNWLNSF